jgi:hypothetical protein
VVTTEECENQREKMNDELAYIIDMNDDLFEHLSDFIFKKMSQAYQLGYAQGMADEGKTAEGEIA